MMTGQPRLLRVRLASLLLGVICGLAISFTVAGRRVERTAADNQNLRTELREARENLERISAGLNHSNRAVIQEIVMTIAGTSPPEELEPMLRQKLQVLIGKNLDQLDPELVGELLHRIELSTGGDRYAIHLEQAVLARKSYFRIRVSAGADLDLHRRQTEE